jgi:hypothetical protein
MEKKYGIKYRVENGSFGVEEIISTDSGACDEILWASIMNGPDGAMSAQWASMDSKGEPLSMVQVFKVWALLAASLENEQSLSFEFRDIAKQVHERVKKYVLSKRDIK